MIICFFQARRQHHPLRQHRQRLVRLLGFSRLVRLLGFNPQTLTLFLCPSAAPKLVVINGIQWPNKGAELVHLKYM